MMLQAISQGVSERPNEDAFVAYQRDDGQPRYVLAAIDGATSVANFAPLQHYLTTQRNNITPASLAATVTRDAILAMLGQGHNDDIDPRELILRANDALRQLLDEVAPGIFDVEQIKQIQPTSQELLNDPRKFRLFLPAAVLTVVTIDTDVGLLRYAHAGDTALLICYDDGHVEVPTRHKQPLMDYESALALASQTALKRQTSMKDALDDPFIRALDRDHRIYHNYVDEQGKTVPERGVGVVNGLPELEDYIKSGIAMIQDAEAVMVISDGFWWPATLHETEQDYDKRVRQMWQRIRQDGLLEYIAALRQAERTDSAHEQYPRFKLHDDATAVILWLS